MPHLPMLAWKHLLKVPIETAGAGTMAHENVKQPFARVGLRAQCCYFVNTEHQIGLRDPIDLTAKSYIASQADCTFYIPQAKGQAQQEPAAPLSLHPSRGQTVPSDIQHLLPPVADASTA